MWYVNYPLSLSLFTITCFQVLSYVLLKQSISIRVLACCVCIVAGFLLGIKEEDNSVANFNIYGVFCGILASASVAAYSIYIKRTLAVVEGNIWRLQIYNNINAVILLSIVMIVIGEVPVLLSFEYFHSLLFWGLLFISGIFGIAIGYVTSLQIKVTTPLTHNVSGTAKACFQTILACVWFSEVRSLWWWMCNFMVLGGSSAYTYVRMIEMTTDMKESPNVVISHSEPPKNEYVETTASGSNNED